MQSPETSVDVVLRLPFAGAREYRVTGSGRDESIPSIIRRSNGYYEPEVMKAIGASISPEATCFDIGANLGVLSIAMASLASRGTVYAFEPIPETFSYLQHNLATNGITNVIAVNAGCYSTPKTLEFHYVPEYGGGAFLSPAGVSDHREQKTMVPCTTIDIFMRERGIKALDLVKIDVEGAEEDVVAGARATLLQYHPVLLVEFNLAVSEKFFGRGLESLHASIASLGYDIFLVNRLDDGIWPVTDYAALMARIDAQGGVGDVLCRPTVAR